MDVLDRPAARVVRPRWRGLVLVCGKCLKRHDDGAAIRRTLKTEVKAQNPVPRQKIRVAKTGCLGICPKGAAILASARTLASGDVVMVRGSGEVADAVSRLL